MKKNKANKLTLKVLEKNYGKAIKKVNKSILKSIDEGETYAYVLNMHYTGNEKYYIEKYFKIKGFKVSDAAVGLKIDWGF